MRLLIALMIAGSGWMTECVSAAEPDSMWPAFLGAGASEIDPTSIPLKWSPTKNLKWTTPIPGYGQSSPVIVGDRVYLTSVEGQQKETLHVICLSLTTGKILWDRTEESTYPEKSSVYISRAAPTPVADGDGVYAYFESGDVLAFDPKGKLRWRTSLSELYTPPSGEFGLSASPVQIDDQVVILIDDPKTAYLVSLDKATGKVNWKTDRAPRTSWSSPSVVTVGGTPQVVVSSAGSVDGYSTEGNQLWTFDEVGGNTGTTPLPVGEGTGQFLIAASPGRRGENAALAPKSNGMMRVEKTAGEWKAGFVWTNPEPKPSWASPMAHDGVAWWINRVGVVYAIDAKTGEELYTKRIGQSAWATPVVIGDRLYIFGRDGLTTVLSTGREFETLAENELWTDDAPPINRLPQTQETDPRRAQSAAMFSRPTLYGAAIVDGHIVLRTGSQVFCIGK